MAKGQEQIDKINEQINNILGENKTSEVEDTNDEDISTSTIKIDSIDDIDNEISEEDDTVKTSKIDTLEEDITSNDDSNIKDNSNVEKKIEEQIPNKKNNKKKKVIILSIIIGVIIIILIVFLILFLNKKDDTVVIEEDKALTKSEQKKIINNFGEAVEGVIAVYYQNQSVLLEYSDAVKLIDFDYSIECSDHDVYDDGLVYLNNCKIDGVKTSYSYGTKQEETEVVTSDDVVKVYVDKTSHQTTLLEPKNLDNYDVYEVKIDGVYYDLSLLSEYSSNYLIYFDEDYNGHLINFKTGKKALNSLNYTNILPIKVDDYYDTNYVGVQINDKWGIYNLNTWEKVVDTIYDSISPYLYMGTSGPSESIDTLDSSRIAVYNNDYYGVIDYKTGNVIIPITYSRMLKSGNYLWVEDASGGHIFDYSGNEYLNGKYNKLYGVINGTYILVNDKDSVKMIKMDGKVLYNYGKLTLGKINFGMMYNDQALFQFYKDESNYDDCIEISYDTANKTGESKDYMCGGVAKPILYLYPEKKTNVTISFEHPELLETTYPKFTGKWEVTAYKNGDLYDKNGNYYYALYWDEVKVHSVDFSTGFYVEADEAIDFLEEKLTYIGLNAKERNEFIMYWLPKLEKNGKSLVYFELTEERESYNKINISPKPDSLLRVVIHVKKVDKKVDIKKESLTKFKRSGFTAVEWGGTTY